MCRPRTSRGLLVLSHHPTLQASLSNRLSAAHNTDNTRIKGHVFCKLDSQGGTVPSELPKLRYLFTFIFIIAARFPGDHISYH
jgi:hypothetical protein